MAKRATTARRGRPATASTRSNSNRTVSRSNTSGTGRGRRPKSMDEYIDEDNYTDDGGDQEQFYQTLQRDVEEYDVEQPRVQRRAGRGDARIGNNFGAVNRGRGRNQYTNSSSGRARSSGTGDSAARIRDLFSDFADRLIDELG